MEYMPLSKQWDEDEMVENIKFVWVQITNNLSWSLHDDPIIKKADQCRYFLRGLRTIDMSATILSNFSRCTTENILSVWITARYGSCSVQNYTKLQSFMSGTQSITQTTN